MSYANNVDVGEATVTVTGTAPYTGSVSQVFRVNPAAITSASLSFSTCYYDGTEKSPVVTATSSVGALVEGRDYRLSVPAGRKAAGRYQYAIQGTGNFTGEKILTLTIAKTRLSNCAVSKIAKMSYTGQPLKPKVKAKFQGHFLREGVDYALKYAKNTNCGTATVKVVGKGSCRGSRTLEFRIAPADMSASKISNVKSKTYNGGKQIQAPKVKFKKRVLKEGRDYNLSYKRNVNAGNALLIVKGAGNFKGRISKSFRINRLAISKTQIDPIGQQQSTGGAVRPSPAVHANGRTLVLGRDYTLSYRNNYNAGTAYVTVTGRGNYQGSTTRSFTIIRPVLQTVYITSTGECYHRDWCSSLRRSKFAISRSDAVARGYRPCSNCRP